MRIRPFLPLAFAAMASPALAQDTQDWVLFPAATTANLAALGWHQVGAAAVSDWYPFESGDLLVTFWEGEFNGARITLRCMTRRYPDQNAMVEWCERPVGSPLMQDLLGGPQP